MTMRSGSRDIIFLLGAGASAEAGIPVSADMVSSVEIHCATAMRRAFIIT